MSRREEVEAILTGLGRETVKIDLCESRELARTLADEVDAERAIVTKLLAMLADNTPGRIHGVTYYTDAQNKQAELYNRALEIAGRKE